VRTLVEMRYRRSAVPIKRVSELPNTSINPFESIIFIETRGLQLQVLGEKHVRCVCYQYRELGTSPV